MTYLGVALFSVFFFTASVLTQAWGVTVEIWGDSTNAPVYVLNGTATTELNVTSDESIKVRGDFQYVTSDAASPRIYAFGTYNVSRNFDWNADLAAASKYTIASYGDLISVGFKHLAKNKKGGSFLVEGYNCTSGQILSQGSMILTESEGSYSFSGAMGGYVLGKIGKITVKYCGYSDEPFTQNVTLNGEADWGEWYGKWTFSKGKKNKVTGSGFLYIGSSGPDGEGVIDSSDSVRMTVSGSWDAGSGNYTWIGSGKAQRDKKVRVRITNDETDVQNGVNSVTAVGQTRPF